MTSATMNNPQPAKVTPPSISETIGTVDEYFLSSVKTVAKWAIHLEDDIRQQPDRYQGQYSLAAMQAMAELGVTARDFDNKVM